MIVLYVFTVTIYRVIRILVWKIERDKLRFSNLTKSRK